MTRLVERIIIDIELDPEPSPLELHPREQLRRIWGSIGNVLDARGRWRISGPGIECQITNLGVEEMPEEGGGDN